MTGSLPLDVQHAFDRFVTTEYVTIDRGGQPIAWPVNPYYSPGAPHISVTTGLGYPKKADDAQRNPRVALLFSDPTGSGLERPPMVLVQGTAVVDDRDLAANQRRYEEESLAKLPALGPLPPTLLRRMLGWYYKRIYVHVRPERVYAWPQGDPGAEPALFDDRLEEVRSGHNEEPEESHARQEAGERVWGPRLESFAGEYGGTAVLAIVAPDGFPFAVRLPVRPDPVARLLRIETEPLGAPLEPGRACLTAHVHAPDFTWQRNFQVRGDLVETDEGWAMAPHKIVGGLESPPGSRVAQLRRNARKGWRFAQTARREARRRA